jgi:hypothetical protein
MIFEHGAIYYASKDFFDFDSACHFFAENGVVMYVPDSNSTRIAGLAGLILEIDENGEYRALTYEEAEKAAYEKKFFKLRLKLDPEDGSDIAWWMRCKESLFIQTFYFDSFLKKEQDTPVRIIFDFFLSELPKKSLLGMYIDKEDKTAEFDWADFFADEKARLDILPDTVCVRKEKLDYVKVADGYIVHPLSHGFYAITRDPAVLCCFPLS